MCTEGVFWLVIRYCVGTCPEGLRTIKNTSLRIASLWADNRTLDLTNRKTNHSATMFGILKLVFIVCGNVLKSVLFTGRIL